MIPVKHLLVAFLICVSVSSYAQFRLYEKGHESYKSGKYDEAIKSFTDYLTKGTRDKTIDIDVFYVRALSHYKLNNFKEAIPDFEETVLRGHANKGNIYWFMAKCYDQLSDNSECLNSYNNAIRELGDKPESRAKLLYERSLIHYRMGNFIETRNDLSEGLQAQPSNAEIKKELEKLEKEQHVALRQTEIKGTDSGKSKTSSAVKNESASGKTPVAKGGEPRNNTSVAKTESPTASAKKKEIDASTVKTPEEKKVTPANKVAENTVTTAKNNSVDKKSKKSASDKTEKKPANTEVKDLPVASNRETTLATKESTSEPAALTLADIYSDEKRYALVIGNSNYPKEIGVLRNPINDASDVAKELENAHFDVTLLTNATYGQIRAALMKFKEKLDGGERDKTVGLFYYAGHGLQFEDENYLVPTDADVEMEDDIPRYCFPINRMVLANMERSNTRMNIVILDACRNNPFPSLNRSLNNSGLGEMKRARGSFIAYATSPGSVASDGAGRNGLYTQELLKAMKKQGLTIEQVFKEVRANVLKLSSNKQNTWDSSNIVGEFHFMY